MNSRFDIVIIGGGISGCVTANLLQKAGFSTAVIERSDLKSFKAGESLTPKCKRWFDSLGIYFSVAEAVEYYGVHASWGSDQTESSPFIFNPYGNGLAIDRSGFELKLMAEAKKNGAVIRMLSEIKSIRFKNECWEIKTEEEDDRNIFYAKLIIVATGRNTFQAIDRSRHIYYDRQVALSAVYCHTGSGIHEKYLFVESLPGGWFYSNNLPEGNTVVSVLTDADLMPSSKLLKGCFHHQIAQTKWSKQVRLQRLENPQIFVSDARTRWTENQSGKNWLRIGDAAFTIDPLSGQGIEKNFEMIYYCLENIKSFLHNTGHIHERYLDFNRQIFSKYLTARITVYEAEKRWPDNMYWKRRMHLQISDYTRLETWDR